MSYDCLLVFSVWQLLHCHLYYWVEMIFIFNCFFRVLACIRYPHELGNGKSGFRRKKNNTCKQYASMLGEPGSEAPFSGQSACFSCSLNRRITRPTLRRSIPRAFLDKSTFHISKRDIGNTSVSTPGCFWF